MGTLKMVYYSLIHPHISYAVILYGSTTNNNLHDILLSQKRAIHVMLKLRQQDSVKEKFTSW